MADLTSQVDSVGLKELGDVPVDRVIATMEEMDHRVTYRDLYYRWERLNWRVEELDFSTDLKQWEALPEESRARLLFTLNNFYHGEDVVAETLAPYVQAAPQVDQKIFLTTQLVDEARHVVFFDRFYTEVVKASGDQLQDRLAQTRSKLPSGFETLFYKDLVQVSQRISREPDSMEALVDGVMLYHLVLEGALALTGQRFVLAWLRDQDLLPAFRSGFTAVTRDESRHVVFGTMLLKELIGRDKALESIVVERLLRSIPLMATVQQPLDGDLRYTKFFNFRLRDQFLFGLNALMKRMRAVGVEFPRIPSYRLPFPAGLTKRDLKARIDERAANDDSWTPGKALAQMMDVTAEVVFQFLPVAFSPEAAKGLDGIYEIVLEGDDPQTWHLKVTDQQLEVVRGPCPSTPDVRFKMDSDVWVRISKDDLDGAEAFVLGLVETEGDALLSSHFDDLFPGPDVGQS